MKIFTLSTTDVYSASKAVSRVGVYSTKGKALNAVVRLLIALYGYDRAFAMKCAKGLSKNGKTQGLRCNFILEETTLE